MPCERPDGSLILFRKLGNPLSPADHDPPCVNWQAEYYAPSGRGFPSGIAWVKVAPKPRPKEWLSDAEGQVVFVLVADDCRQQGIAMELIKACLGRWPKVTITSAISDAGEALVDEAMRELGIQEFYGRRSAS